jgi:RNA polymerase sigma-70 factor, ECF subfamily
MAVNTNDEATAPASTLELAVSGDQKALGQIFSSCCTKQLYWTAFQMLGSHEEAEDAVQDALLAAVRNLKSFEGRSKFSTWLTRVVLNASLMRRRKLRRHTTTSIDQEPLGDGGAPLAAKLADSRPGPEEAYAREEELAILKGRLEQLPASYRSVLWLRDVEGMTTEEAAEELGLPQGTLKSRLHRARLAFSQRVYGNPRSRVSRARRPARDSRGSYALLRGSVEDPGN